MTPYVKTRLANVFVFPNGMVAVTDANGQQMPEYQGALKEVRRQIILAADDGTRFHGWPGILDGGTVLDLIVDLGCQYRTF